MKIQKVKNSMKIIRKGGIGVMPTDTLYGLVGSALSKNVVEKIYKVRKRNPKKPMIVLISSIADLKKFDVVPEKRVMHVLKKVWPGPVSVILKCESKKYAYLHRGTHTLAFRVPKQLWLRALLKKTGPLVAPSANIEGQPPAHTIEEAHAYFGTKVDGYYDRGILKNPPSLLIEIRR